MATKDSFLTKKEAVEYVSKNLSIGDVDSRLKNDRKQLLDSVICSFLEKLPIQTITLHTRVVEERRRPSLTAVKMSIMEGTGGVCYELNIFMYGLLQALGFETHLLVANVSRPKNHVVCIVRNLLTDGDLFLVDAGCGFPTFQSVDLTFQQQSQVYQQSFLNYKFVKSGATILRLHSPIRKAPSAGDNGETAMWKRYYDFDLTTMTLDEIDTVFDDVFENPSSTSSHHVLRCTFFPGQRACALRNNVILRENEERILEETSYDTDKDLATAICNTFPMFADRKSTVEKAIDTWKLSQT